MKKLFFALAIMLATFATAQSKYEKAMKSNIAKIEEHLDLEQFTSLANDFTRIGDAEKNQWLPYYYAAFSKIQKGRIMMREGKTQELDEIADDAQKSLDQAKSIESENAEIFILQKMIHGLKMMVNPMARYMTEGGAAAEALAKAEKLDPENPRITLLKAEDLYFTPEQFGGSKDKGLEMFGKAKEQFSSYKIKSEIHPNWGAAEAEYFLTAKP